MDLGRLAFRSLLLLAVAALVAGCAAPPEQAVDEGSQPANETTGEAPGCIQEGQTGSGDGDIAADRACPGMTGPDGETTAP